MNAKQRRKLVRQHKETILTDIVTSRMNDDLSAFSWFLKAYHNEPKAMYHTAKFFLRRYHEHE